ncbi:MAG: hypothetical protein IPJ33_14830 [Gammaproteobacteria bacterium]|nr:hypothetical protein [Gammaproteobacteria bacterium]MBP6053527.1 hypothetical protein [Pseudomonadales bacterium]MBK6584959.1 hypothetical protein [Gammaproteobacteria bacterium]MBK7170783.1 hypothetical protein [Gammaproteobacteria bacterium]MBK7519536.1 hypothetical protein [Gammaproteobacteria bacterium]
MIEKLLEHAGTSRWLQNHIMVVKLLIGTEERRENVTEIRGADVLDATWEGCFRRTIEACQISFMSLS